MRGQNSFRDYTHFREELLRYRSGTWTAAVEEIADDMYHNDFQDEFSKLWDKAEDDD